MQLRHSTSIPAHFSSICVRQPSHYATKGGGEQFPRLSSTPHRTTLMEAAVTCRQFAKMEGRGWWHVFALFVVVRQNLGHTADAANSIRARAKTDSRGHAGEGRFFRLSLSKRLWLASSAAKGQRRRKKKEERKERKWIAHDRRNGIAAGNRSFCSGPFRRVMAVQDHFL